MAAYRDSDIAFAFGWLDFAYFLQHRNDFLDRTHGHYMRSSIDDQSAIKSKDCKVLHDGSIVPFDPEKAQPGGCRGLQRLRLNPVREGRQRDPDPECRVPHQ